MHWALPPAPTAWPLGVAHGRIGRTVAPQQVTPRAVFGDRAALQGIVWSWEGKAVVSTATVAEVYDIDRARQSWRVNCGAPVVGVGAFGVVCGDDHGVKAFDWNGKATWSSTLPFVTISHTRVVVGAGSVLDVATGSEQYVVRLPSAARAIAACDREVFAVLADRRLARFTMKQLWAVATAKADTIVGVDACEATILVMVAGDRGPALVALDRDGKLLGRIDDVRGFWPARDDANALEVATKTEVTRCDRNLARCQPLDLPLLGPQLARHGERRLVRATPTTAVLLDRNGVRAYVPLGESGAVMTDDNVFTGTRLFGLPGPWLRALNVPATPHTVMVPAELRDLPPVVTAEGSGSGGIVHGIAIVGAHLYAATQDGVDQLDLATLKWGWHVADAPVSIAADGEIVVYATATKIVALAPDGGKRWEVPGTGVVEAAGDIVLVKRGAGARVLDAVTGALVATLASGDGAPVRATTFELDGAAIVVRYEQNRVTARLPDARMVPLWSVEVAGVVAGLSRSNDGVLVALEDGDAYRLDAHTGDAVAIAGIGLAWHASGDAITGEALGGPVPGAIKPPLLPPEVYKPTDLEQAPAIATPWPPPPPMTASWQLTIYDPSGGVRTRNDYAVTGATPGLRIGAAPFVYVSGRTALVIDPVHGDPLRRVELPDNGAVFSTIVDGRAIVGTILAAPLRAVAF